MSLAVTTEGLTRYFDDVVAVDDLTLEIRVGEVFGLLGHNGAGKTTTVRLLNGVLTPSSGAARVLGLDPLAEGPGLRTRTGVLTEGHSLDARMTARETLRFFGTIHGVVDDDLPSRIESLLERFGLAERGDDPTGEYSKGMRQRLAIARSLVHDPDLLFLDEPTAALDPIAARAVDDLIVQLSREQGSTVVVCTHNLTEAQRVCDRVAVMEQGRVIAVGTPTELGATHGGPRRLELEIARDDIASLRAEAPSVHVVKEADGTAELRIDDVDRADIPGLINRFTASGVRIYRVTPDEPTLEDVYFALHRGGGRP